jgi:hypothetical protein
VARPVSHDRTRLVDKIALWTLSILKSDVGCAASGQYKRRVRSGLSAARASGDRTLGHVRSVLIGASGHLSACVTLFLDRWRSCGSSLNAYMWQRSNGAVQRDRTLWPCQVVSTCASGQPDNSRVKCLTAISCWAAYKYLLASLRGCLLNILTL